MFDTAGETYTPYALPNTTVSLSTTGNCISPLYSYYWYPPAFSVIIKDNKVIRLNVHTGVTCILFEDRWVQVQEPEAKGQ